MSLIGMWKAWSTLETTQGNLVEGSVFDGTLSDGCFSIGLPKPVRPVGRSNRALPRGRRSR